MPTSLRSTYRSLASLVRRIALPSLLLVVSFLAATGSAVDLPGAFAQEADLESPAAQAPDFQPPDVACPPGSLPAPPPISEDSGYVDPEECLPVVDRREAAKVPFDPPELSGHFAAARQYSGPLEATTLGCGPPNYTNFDAGTLYDRCVLAPEELATFRAYMEVYPEYTADEFDNESASGYYMTAINRMAHGIEFLARFRESNVDPEMEKSWFMVYDWSCTPEFPCENGYPDPCAYPDCNAFVRAWRMDTVPCWYKMLEDNTGHYVNYTYYRNSTWIVESRNPPADPHLWRNAVSVLNRCTGQYDVIYSHDYAVNPDDCSFTCANEHDWAGVAERFFPGSEKVPVIAKQGFHHQTLDYDGQTTRLKSWNSFFIDPSGGSAPWSLYYLSDNDTWEAGTYQDDDGDDVPNSSDPDIDADGVLNGDEGPCGATAPPGYTAEAHPYRRPERVDGQFAAIDDDGDTQVDEALPGGVSSYDCDGDGYTGSAEDHVYSYLSQTTGDQKTCQEYDTNFPDPNQLFSPSLRWPSDLRGDSISFNKIDILDLASFYAPIRYVNSDVGTRPGDIRWDLVPGKGVFSYDINVADLAQLSNTGPTGTPPMLDGQAAFNGPPCPYNP